MEGQPLIETAARLVEVPAPVRNLMVELLSSGCVVHREDSAAFALLSRREVLAFVRSVFSLFNVDLVFSPETGVAFIRNLVREETEGSPEGEAEGGDSGPGTIPWIDRQLRCKSPDDGEDRLLIRRVSLSPFKCIALVLLRKFYTSKMSSLDDSGTVIIDLEELKSAMVPYLGPSGSDMRDTKKLNGAMADFASYHLVRKVRAEDEGRYEILPSIRHLLDYERMNGFLEGFRQINAGACDAAGQDGDPLEEGEPA
ncbi:MAG: DUF4194 domain-containing protein [Succinivibrionaceae bacterium]|nr:DUF4194 domain-containing protein [Succinivibrionaceae bacterium]